MRPLLGCLVLSIALGLSGACFCGIVVIAITLDAAVQAAPDVVPDVIPVDPQPVCPGPDCPDNKNKQPDNRRKRWAAEDYQSVRLVRFTERGQRVTDGPVHNGQEVLIDLPSDLLKRNIASKGLGCCVFRSANYIGIFNNISSLIDLPERMKEAGVAGGGWPEKFDEVMKRFAPDFQYIQVQDGNWDIVKLALKTGRCVAITVMGGQHMVNLLRMDGMAAFRDNNFTGPSEIWWMSEAEAKRECQCSYTGGKFWAVIPLNGRPPMPPTKSGPVAAGATNAEKASALMPKALPGSYSWGKILATGDGPDQWPLMHDGKQVGAFVPDWDCYCERLGPGEWGKTWRRPPVQLPEEALIRMESMPPGVAKEHLALRACYSICGQEVSREEAMAALIDDSQKLSLTAIGSKQETARVRADLDRLEFAGFKSRVIFQEYAPDNWAISTQRFGFDTTAHPTVYLQKPDGSVLWHVQQYEGTATMAALRKRDPNYNQNTDPGMPNAPAPLLDDAWGPVTIVAALGGGGTFLMGILSSLAALLHALLESLLPLIPETEVESESA